MLEKYQYQFVVSVLVSGHGIHSKVFVPLCPVWHHEMMGTGAALEDGR